MEIDGEQHYADKKIVEHDKRRCQTLLDLGWKGIRIRWAHFKRLTEEDKHTTILNIRPMMKW